MTRILCIGDSHTRLIGVDQSDGEFRYNVPVARRFGSFDAHVLSLRAATASGLANPDSQKQSNARAQQAIKTLDPDVICFGFGQVDAEVTFYLRALRAEGLKPNSVYAAFQTIYARYLHACIELAGSRPFIIKGLNPVSLPTDDLVKRYLKIQFRRYFGIESDDIQNCLVALLDINLLSHCEINQTAALVLKELCFDHGLPYFDIRAKVSDPLSVGLARLEFCARYKPDPHLRLQDEHCQAIAQDIVDMVQECPVSERPDPEATDMAVQA